MDGQLGNVGQSKHPKKSVGQVETLPAMQLLISLSVPATALFPCRPLRRHPSGHVMLAEVL